MVLCLKRLFNRFKYDLIEFKTKYVILYVQLLYKYTVLTKKSNQIIYNLFIII